MKTYLVDIPATTIETYIVFAESPEEAIVQGADGDGEELITGYVPYWNQDRSTWKARRQKVLSNGTVTVWTEEED